ncbi:HEAT repeat domain-containing protein [Sediminibacterium roseum]|uniref:HEAT repeat domain-containing protein n=1 Tax=Sediminibacterium roseum TaxID=1978412 RepID=A0ABX0A121_9BACT|nr:zf-HC2 domain-containing protein [Sediminibacterium roseum]NCI50856.1 HEAT repeat domain-containing protein [Sediminibacterium roseum]
MKCEKEEQITLWINNEMTEAERKAFEKHLGECPACAQELKAEQQLWNMIGELPAPQPSADMRVRFDAMLEDFKASHQPKANALSRIGSKLKLLWSFQPGMQLAYTVILVVIGIGLGSLLKRGGSDQVTRAELAEVTTKLKDMNETMMLALIENPSASERIRGVSYTEKIKTANKEVIDALLSTLNNDQNVNVRLVTLEALTQYTYDASVREGLVKSIAQQDSPLMQAALADVMLKLQEKRSVQSFRKLLEQKDLDKSIRGKIEETITKLI